MQGRGHARARCSRARIHAETTSSLCSAEIRYVVPSGCDAALGSDVVLATQSEPPRSVPAALAVIRGTTGKVVRLTSPLPSIYHPLADPICHPLADPAARLLARAV
jgi:hypothetical protein